MADIRERQERRAKEASARASLRQSHGPDNRQAEAAELIADTLIDICDILSDIRASVAQLNTK